MGRLPTASLALSSFVCVILVGGAAGRARADQYGGGAAGRYDRPAMAAREHFDESKTRVSARTIGVSRDGKAHDARVRPKTEGAD
jgi:hypothetical protein